MFDTRALAFSSSCSGALWVPLLEKAGCDMRAHQARMLPQADRHGPESTVSFQAHIACALGLSKTSTMCSKLKALEAAERGDSAEAVNKQPQSQA